MSELSLISEAGLLYMTSWTPVDSEIRGRVAFASTRHVAAAWTASMVGCESNLLNCPSEVCIWFKFD